MDKTYEELLLENKRLLADLICEDCEFAKALPPGDYQRKDIIQEMKENTGILNEILDAEKEERKAASADEMERQRMELEVKKLKHQKIKDGIDTGVRIAGGVGVVGFAVWALCAVMEFEEKGTLCTKASAMALRIVQGVTKIL